MSQSMNITTAPDPANQQISALESLPEHSMRIDRPVAQDSTPFIYNLPNEILLEIFSWVQRSSNGNEWLVITWVCQHWRAVALGAAYLWSTIKSYKNVAALETFLQRSRDVSVTLHVTQTEENNAALSETLWTHATRLHALYLELGWESDVFNYFILCPQTTTAPLPPNLDTPCVFDKDPSDAGVVLSRSDRDLIFPRLRTLHVMNMNTYYDPSLFIGLTTLRLDTVQLESDGAYRSDLFLHMLTRCPLLESLEIEDELCLPYPLGDDPAPSLKVSLSRLHSLRVHLSELDLVHLLSHLVLPSLSHVYLKLRSQMEGDFLERLIPSSRPSLLDFAKFQTLTFCVIAYPETESSLGDSGSRPEEITIHVVDRDVTPLICSYLEKLPAAFTSLTRLRVAGNLVWVDANLWAETLKGLLHLTSLHLHEESRPRLYRNGYNDTFTKFFAALATSSSTSIVCPQLEELSVESNNQILPQTLEVLVSTLNVRITNNALLRTLAIVELRNSGADSYQVLRELKNLVVSFSYESRTDPASEITWQ